MDYDNAFSFAKKQKTKKQNAKANHKTKCKRKSQNEMQKQIRNLEKKTNISRHPYNLCYLSWISYLQQAFLANNHKQH